MRTVTVSHSARVLPFRQFSVCRCRRDICLISSPPLTTSFGSQNTRFYHECTLLLFSLFLLHENGLQFCRKHHDQILLIHTISMVVHTSGSMHCRRRYRDPELAGFFVYLSWFPIQIRRFSVISPSYGTCRISTDRYLRDEYDYGENVGIGPWVTEKLSNYFPYLEETLCF